MSAGGASASNRQKPRGRIVTVSKAKLTGDMGSLGQASNKLIRQYQFPYEYELGVDILIEADHDRMLTWNYDAFRRICQKHIKTGGMGIGSWAKQATHEEVMSFLMELFEEICDPCHREVAWTGYRITGSVNRSNGNPVYHLWLFANDSGRTKVYTGNNAPNVERPAGLRGKDLICWPGHEE
jgi:hypothetical protein